MSHICDPQSTELAGFDSAGWLVGHATFGLFDTPDGVNHLRWRVDFGLVAEYWCDQEQAERALREAGAVTIKEGDGRR